MEEYMKLVSDTKNERITQLLEETEGYLKELGYKVEEQKLELRKVKSRRLLLLSCWLRVGGCSLVGGGLRVGG